MSVKINTKKKVVVKKYKGKRTEQKAKTIGQFVGVSNRFDKHECDYINHKGLTYVLYTPPLEEEEEIAMQLESSVTVDEDLKARYFAGLSEEEKALINEIKEEYGL